MFPFSEESIRLYQRYAGDPSIATHTAQAALEALRTKGLVWRSARGVYALEDESWTEWLVGTSLRESERADGQ